MKPKATSKALLIATAFAGAMNLAAPAMAKSQLRFERVVGPVRVRPDEKPVAIRLRLTVPKGFKRDVRVSAVRSLDLVEGTLVDLAWLDVVKAPKASRGRTRAFKIELDRESLPSPGAYRVTFSALPYKKVTTNVEFLVGSDETPAWNRPATEVLIRGQFHALACAPLGSGCRSYDAKQPISLTLVPGAGVANKVVVSAPVVVEEDSGRSVGVATILRREGVVAFLRREGVVAFLLDLLGTRSSATIPFHSARPTPISFVLPQLSNPGVYTMTVSADALGPGGAEEATVTIVVTDSPWAAVSVLAAGVFLSFAVAYLRGRRARLLIRRRTALLTTRLDSFARRYPADASTPLLHELRAAVRHVEFLARSEGVNAGEVYLEKVEGLYQKLNTLKALEERAWTLKHKIEERVQGATADPQAVTTALTAVAGALNALDELSGVLDEGFKQNAAGVTASLKELESLEDRLTASIKDCRSALEGLGSSAPIVGDPAYPLGTSAGDEAASEPLGPPPLSNVVMWPPTARVDELMTYTLVPARGFVRWVVTKVGVFRSRKLEWVEDNHKLEYSFSRRGPYEVVAQSVGADGTFGYVDFRVKESLTGKQQSRLTRIDLTLTGISFIIALVTGMWLFYYREGLEYFGDPEHYFQLFLWGVGVDRATKLSGVREKIEARPPT